MFWSSEFGSPSPAISIRIKKLHQPSLGLAFFRFRHNLKLNTNFFESHFLGLIWILISSFFDILYLELIYLDVFDHVFSWYSWISSSPIKRPISTNKYFNVALQQSLSDAIIVKVKFQQIIASTSFNLSLRRCLSLLTLFQWFNVSTFIFLI